MTTDTTTPAKRRFSRDHRTAWTYAYNVYRGTAHLGLVYRGSDERWHSIDARDGAVDGGFLRRSDAGYFLEQPR